MTTKKKHLIELMIEAGVKWPEGAEYAVQDADSVLAFYKTKPRREVGRRSWGGAAYVAGSASSVHDICHNWHQTIVTKAQYEKELAERDGWIRWEGGRRPVSGDDMVLVKTRSGSELQSEAWMLNWVGYGHGDDIIAYRVIGQASKPAPKPEPKPKPEHREPVASTIPGNTIEQRIAELRAMEKQVAELRAKLTNDLHTMGITWLDGAICDAKSVQPAITDWRDLRVGDVIEFEGVDGEWDILNLEDEYDEAPIKVSDDINAECTVEGWVNILSHPWRFIRRP